MDALKSILAALFVSEVVFFVSIFAMLFVRAGFGTGRATGLGAILNYALSPVPIACSVVGFLASLWLFLRR